MARIHRLVGGTLLVVLAAGFAIPFPTSTFVGIHPTQAWTRTMAGFPSTGSTGRGPCQATLGRRDSVRPAMTRAGMKWTVMTLRDDYSDEPSMLDTSLSTINSEAGERKKKKKRQASVWVDPLTPPPSPDSFPAYEPTDFFRYELIHRSKKSKARVGRSGHPASTCQAPDHACSPMHASWNAASLCGLRSVCGRRGCSRRGGGSRQDSHAARNRRHAWLRTGGDNRGTEGGGPSIDG
jgi:hypothetical protein